MWHKNYAIKFMPHDVHFSSHFKVFSSPFQVMSPIYQQMVSIKRNEPQRFWWQVDVGGQPVSNICHQHRCGHRNGCSTGFTRKFTYIIWVIWFIWYESYEKHLKNDFSIWSGRGMLFHLNTITRTTLIVSRATTTRVATRTNTCKILSTSIVKR